MYYLFDWIPFYLEFTRGQNTCILYHDFRSNYSNNTNVATIVSIYIFFLKLSKQQKLFCDEYRTSDNLGLNFIQAYIDVKSMTEYWLFVSFSLWSN